MIINGIEFDSQDLISKEELLNFLRQNGANDLALDRIRDSYYKKYGNELIWRYPISDGMHLGTFIVAIKEGFISLPFDIVDKNDYEQMELNDAAMFDVDGMKIFIDDWKHYSDDLLGAMEDMLQILNG